MSARDNPMSEPTRFSWPRHFLRLIADSIPLRVLMLLALIFEFDDGPLENWWLGRNMGYPWSECIKHHRRRLVRDQPRNLVAQVVAKLALITVGPLLIVVDELSIATLDWSHSRSVSELLRSWGRVGAIRGVPE